MKKWLLGLITSAVLTTAVNAQDFGPMKDGVINMGNGYTQVQMYLYSKEGGKYYFTIGGKVINAANTNQPNLQTVLPGMTAYFPMTINNKYIVNNHIMICSTEYQPVGLYSREVCFNVKVQDI